MTAPGIRLPAFFAGMRRAWSGSSRACVTRCKISFKVARKRRNRTYEKAGPPMAVDTIAYDVSFPDFQFLQSYMTRRVFSRNRHKFGPAFLGVVLCALFLAIAMVINVNPHRVGSFLGTDIRYPL